MAEIVLPTKALAVNPLKVSQPMGASLAFLGLARTMPLEHGARGCTSFNKLFFMRHFREPIALQTTAMDQVTTVIGSDDNVVEALRTIAEKNQPDIVGLITTGLSETQGADIHRTIKDFRAAYPQHAAMSVVPVNATDTLGCLETGFARAVEALIRAEWLPINIWEPAAGRGAIVDVLRAHGRTVTASDIVDYGGLDFTQDFLTTVMAPTGCGAIVTNPPYRIASAFVRHALDLGVDVYLLLRLAFIESANRSDILEKGGLARIHVFRSRLPMMHRDGWTGPRASSAIPFAWFCWQRGHHGPTVIDRISARVP